MEQEFENQLTKIFPNGLTGKEIIRRITEIYHAGYILDNPNFDIYDQLQACEVLDESEKLSNIQIAYQDKGFSVKGKDVCLGEDREFGVDDFPNNKEDVPYHLAITLEDEENLAWYNKLARERRIDFLKNCLRRTLEASAKGVIIKTKAAYFAGVVKFQTFQQERLKRYKEKYYRHTSLYGFSK